MKRSIFILVFVLFLLSVSICCADFSSKESLVMTMPLQVESNPAQTGGDEALYEQAYSLYQNKQYYDAHEAFIKSQFGDWERMAKKCVRRWPSNGEIWREPTQWFKDTKITFKVRQPKTSAIFLRIYKDNQPISYVFVGGTDDVTIWLPGNGTYTIKDGVGSEWYDVNDTFGPNGAYETMLFGIRQLPTVFFEQKYAYTLTINIEEATGENVGSEDAEWQNFRK